MCKRSIEFFDNWTIGESGGPTGPGLPKLHPSDENPGKYDHVMFIWRNGFADGSGYAVQNSPGSMLGDQANTYSHFGAYGRVPLDIVRHEFSHLLYGGNDFHCGGGGWGYSQGHYWMSLQGGWGNMSGARLDVADGAVLRVRKGGTLELMGGSTLNVASGGLVIIEEDLLDENDGRLVPSCISS